MRHLVGMFFTIVQPLTAALLTMIGWNWFVTKLGAPQMSFLVALGIVALVSVWLQRYDPDVWQAMFSGSEEVDQLSWRVRLQWVMEYGMAFLWMLVAHWLLG